jgi:predicted O-methyltransferase YrrM
MIINEDIDQYQNRAEFIELLKLYITLKPSKVLEIGSLLGNTLQHWMFYANSNTTIISIDYPVKLFCSGEDPRCSLQEEYHKSTWYLWAKRYDVNFHLIADSSLKESTYIKVNEIVDDFDFVFIDGDHSYAAIKHDFETYGNMVCRGIVAFHDIGKNEVSGGYQFWNEIKNNYFHKEILLDPNKEKGIGVLYMI